MASTTIEAAGSKINGTGFQVREQDGWVNISKYAKPADVLCHQWEPRSRSRSTAPTSREIELLEAPNAEQHSAAPTLSTVNEPLPIGKVDTKDLRITRLACLNTATNIIAGTTGRANADEVITLAERLEGWCCDELSSSKRHLWASNPEMVRRRDLSPDAPGGSRATGLRNDPPRRAGRF